MDSDARRRLTEAVEQARARASEAAAEIEHDVDAPRAVATAVREAEEALDRLAERLKADG
jgi:hypothetical protein